MPCHPSIQSIHRSNDRSIHYLTPDCRGVIALRLADSALLPFDHEAQAKALANLEEHFLKVHRAYHLPVGDFPDVAKFRGCMEGHDLSKFPKLDLKSLDVMDTVLTRDIPKLMAMFPQEGSHAASGAAVGAAISHVGQNLQALPPPPPSAPQLMAPPALPPQQIGYTQPYPTAPLAPPPLAPSPFDSPPPSAGGWAVVSADKARYDEVFASLGPVNGFASGMAVRRT